MLEFINFFTGAMGGFVDLLFSLPLATGVSVGSFLLGCAVFALVLGHLLGRFLISSDRAERMGISSGRRASRHSDDS